MKNRAKKIQITPTRDKAMKFITLFCILIIFAFSFMSLDIEWGQIIGSSSQALYTIKQFFNINWSVLPRVLEGMSISIAIAFVAVILSVTISLPVSFLAAANLATNGYLATFLKAFVAVLRSVPTLVWGLMVIASMGFGNVGGVLTLMFELSCFLIRSFTTSIEELGNDIIEALKSSGAPWILVAMKGALPMAFPSMLAWIAISFEMAVAASISLGMIGVNGVGKVLTASLAQYKYGEVTVGILVIFVTMYIFEISTVKLRRSIKNEK